MAVFFCLLLKYTLVQNDTCINIVDSINIAYRPMSTMIKGNVGNAIMQRCRG